MTSVEYRNHLTPIEQVKQWLSYAVGSATDEKLSKTLEQLYPRGDSTLYVFIDNDGSTAGIVGFKGEGVSAKILHMKLMNTSATVG